MDIGFTGTRFGMTEKQKKAFEEKIKEMYITEFHHGDCIGADKEAHNIVREQCHTAKIFVHPPNNGKLRAHCKGDFTASEKPYFVRNHEIVDACDCIIATPKENHEICRSGTWATIRYAKKNNKKTLIIYPSGYIDVNDGGKNDHKNRMR